MRQLRSSGSVEGVLSNEHSYSDLGRRPRSASGAASSPRVAEYGNPGLRDATPFGVAAAPLCGCHAS